MAVLKFYFTCHVPGAPTTAERVCQVWHNVYRDVPALASRVRTVRLREPFSAGKMPVDALLMPYLRRPAKAERPRLKDKVRACLMRFVVRGYNGIPGSWRNIGMYTDEAGDEQIVVIDLRSLMRRQTDAPSTNRDSRACEVVDRAMARLGYDA